MTKLKIGLAQPNLRPLVYNFWSYLRASRWNQHNRPKQRTCAAYNVLGTYQQEIKREKGKSKLFALRKLLGIPSVRFRWDRDNDILFSYGSLVISNKPYVVYIENDAAVYSYNAVVAQHYLAQWIVWQLIKRGRCRQVVFMSAAGRRGFLNRRPLGARVKEAIKHKSVVLPPVAFNPTRRQPRRDRQIRYLFIATFYMKGGREALTAFLKLARQRQDVRLTVVTKVELLHPSDRRVMTEHPRINLVTNKYDTPDLFTKFYNTHDVFLYPTYRDSFGAVLVEALAAGLPIITTDHYATTEMALVGYNAFVYPNHPLKDYNEKTFITQGKYYSPKQFYHDLFAHQANGGMEPIIAFLYQSMRRLADDNDLRHRFARNSLRLYNQQYHWRKVAAGWDKVFLPDGS